MSDESNARSQAVAQAESISQMVAALNVDYDRLEELRDEKQELIDAVTEAAEVRANRASDDDAITAHQEAMEAEAEWRKENSDELAQLESEAGENTDTDRAREAIQNDALDVQVRSDWHQPGSADSAASEFMVLLSTGGPACRIIGELDEYQQPIKAHIEYQDWFTPWVVLEDSPVSESTLLQYCEQFYFGE